MSLWIDIFGKKNAIFTIWHGTIDSFPSAHSCQPFIDVYWLISHTTIACLSIVKIYTKYRSWQQTQYRNLYKNTDDKNCSVYLFI